MRKAVVFVIFDDFSPILVAPGRGAVERYEHIYFLDRSRCLISDFSNISEGPGAEWSVVNATMLQAEGGRPSVARGDVR